MREAWYQAEEIESVFAGTPSIGPDVAQSMVETRFMAIGQAATIDMCFWPSPSASGTGQIYPSDPVLSGR